MKRNDWFLVGSLMFLVAVFTAFSTTFIINKYFIPKVKTISIMSVLNNQEDESYKKFLDGKISQEEYTKAIETKMAKIQSALDYYSNGKDILLVEEAVIKSNNNNFISITEAVKDYVK